MGCTNVCGEGVCCAASCCMRACVAAGGGCCLGGEAHWGRSVLHSLYALVSLGCWSFACSFSPLLLADPPRHTDEGRGTEKSSQVKARGAVVLYVSHMKQFCSRRERG